MSSFLFVIFIHVYFCPQPPVRRFISIKPEEKNAAFSIPLILVRLMLTTLQRCDYINIHHKVLFPVLLHATNH